MKKILMSCLVLVILVGCSGRKNEEVSGNELPNSNNVSENNNINNQNNDTYNWNTFHVSVGKSITRLYYDGPLWTSAERGLSRAFTPDAKCCLLFTVTVDNLGDNDLFDTATKKALSSMGSILEAETIDTSKRENKKINGLDTINFVGTIHDTKHNLDLYSTGYVFEFADAACGVFGIVYDETQPQELIDLITEYADHMITTVRDKE